MGSSARWPSPRSSRYHAQPNMRTASATRSVTESKKAPRTDAVPAALATGPSNRSCMPVMIRKMMARCRWPVATRTAVAVADTRPVAVSTSAVMPWRWSVSPTGPVVRSTAVRQRPSNMKLLVVRGPGQGSGAVHTSLPSGPRNPGPHRAGRHARWAGPRGLRWRPPRCRTPGHSLLAGYGPNPERRPARTHQCEHQRRRRGPPRTRPDTPPPGSPSFAAPSLVTASAAAGLTVVTAGPAGAAPKRHHGQGRRDRLPHQALEDLLQAGQVRLRGAEQGPDDPRPQDHRDRGSPMATTKDIQPGQSTKLDGDLQEGRLRHLLPRPGPQGLGHEHEHHVGGAATSTTQEQSAGGGSSAGGGGAAF